MSGSSQFLVEVAIDIGDLDAATVAALRAAEGRRAAELRAEGTLQAIWRVRGRWANVGIWRAANEAALRTALDTLPLRPYMRITVTSLDPHPSDPRPKLGIAPRRRDRVSRTLALTPLPALQVAGRRPTELHAATGPLETPAPRQRLHERPAPLPMLLVRKRSGAASDIVATKTDMLEPEGASALHASMGVDLDVTAVAGGGRATVSDMLVETISAWLVEALAADSGAVAAGAITTELIRDAQLSTAVLRTASGEPLIEVTCSGRIGLDRLTLPVGEAPLQLDIGAVRRLPVARLLADGSSEALQIRSLARLELGVRSVAWTPARSAALLQRLIALAA